ncbi:MAG TPA: hypothetical protein VHO06_08275, partial [Polyangia bacterium]|nr:hypothetical protein [Polyangia bacterium]
MRARWAVLGVVLVGAIGGTAWGEPASTGLTGLDHELGSTGRIGTYTPRSTEQIVPAAPEADSAPRAPERQAARPDDPRAGDHAGILAEEELRPTETSVAACRVEVARRRQVSPKKLAAKEVVVRFTVEPDGHVRDAEAVEAPETDLEVAACAKRVLSDWVFAKHAGAA